MIELWTPWSSKSTWRAPLTASSKARPVTTFSPIGGLGTSILATRWKLTSSMALSMLRQIQQSNGELTDEQREECLHLEGAIRDEIRGRKLLNDAVREQVMTARRRGATVTLLDEGGIDDLTDGDLDRVLTALAEAIKSTDADKVIARTVPEGSAIAITVVGLRTADDGSASALGQAALEEDEVDLWLEIPRAVPR